MAKILESIEVKIDASKAIEMGKKAMEGMRCKNCRYWNELPYNKEKGECISTLICEHIFSESYDTVDMYFSPGFGCIHFEGKEDEGDKPTSGT